jgi:hypothetical protein
MKTILEKRTERLLNNLMKKFPCIGQKVDFSKFDLDSKIRVLIDSYKDMTKMANMQKKIIDTWSK